MVFVEKNEHFVVSFLKEADGKVDLLIGKTSSFVILLVMSDIGAVDEDVDVWMFLQELLELSEVL